MSRIADEAMYFGAVADGVESQQEEIAALRQQLAESENLRQGVEFGMDCANAESVRLRQQLADCYAALKEIQAIAESSVKTHGYDKAHIRVADIAKRALP